MMPCATQLSNRNHQTSALLDSCFYLQLRPLLAWIQNNLKNNSTAWPEWTQHSQRQSNKPLASRVSNSQEGRNTKHLTTEMQKVGEALNTVYKYLLSLTAPVASLPEDQPSFSAILQAPPKGMIPLARVSSPRLGGVSKNCKRAQQVDPNPWSPPNLPTGIKYKYI